MKRLITIGIISIFLLSACQKVPITGRRQLNMLLESKLIGMSLNNYSQFIKQNKLSNNSQKSAMVKRVGTKIQQAVEQFMKQNKMFHKIKNYHWEFNLVESNQPNAWCMPGGKVVVYTGILPYTQTETGLAVVMGHEIAHAIARHGNERMSQALLIQMGGVGLSYALKEKPQQTQQMFMAAYGAGAKVGVSLPFSRQHETEADKMGLIFMSMAGYNPSEAVSFWQRMGKSGAKKPPEWLSTHPSDQTRAKNLKAFLPEAMKYYHK